LGNGARLNLLKNLYAFKHNNYFLTKMRTVPKRRTEHQTQKNNFVKGGKRNGPLQKLFFVLKAKDGRCEGYAFLGKSRARPKTNRSWF
jgi:hypothetical protein